MKSKNKCLYVLTYKNNKDIRGVAKTIKGVNNGHGRHNINNKLAVKTVETYMLIHLNATLYDYI